MVRWRLLPFLLTTLIAGTCMGENKVSVGMKAPDFELKGTDGKIYKLSDFKGKKGVIIAWYPKALTGG